MNNNNPMIQTLMNQLQSQNPQGFQVVQQMMSQGGNPEALIKQMMGNINPEQRQAIFKQAQSYGIPNDVLSRIQNMK